ncbi:MAG: sigma-70 family RNA polymerase sigma factor [Lacunisphaera sp.]
MPEKPRATRDFASLYRATVTPLRRHLARILGNSAEAQDIAHDAYIRVYPVVERQAAEKPEAMLYTTARRLAFNRLKRRRIAPFVAEPPIEGPQRLVRARRRPAGDGPSGTPPARSRHRPAARGLPHRAAAPQN